MTDSTVGSSDVGLTLRSVTKRFGLAGAAVLDDVSLHIPPGQFIAVMGRSGSGKSTLLRCAAGLDPVTSGSITWNGVDLQRLSGSALVRLRRSDFAMVHQDYNLLPALTAAENVELPARLGGRRLSREQVAAALATMGLAGRGHQRPAQLSGGEQQRVALARALAVDVRVLLADEPTGALDSGNRDRVLHQLGEIVADGRRSVIMVTHDPWVAARAHRVVFMLDGRLHSQVEHPDVDAVLQRDAPMDVKRPGVVPVGGSRAVGRGSG
jgi:putative ABC transport system ATP-binding protein